MYIEPNIKLYDSFSDLKKDKNSGYFDSIFKKEKLTVDKLYKCKRLFVLAEPGFGKTVLLENLNKNAEPNGFKAIFIDLKSLDTSINLIKNIEKIVRRTGTSINITNKQEILLCLDALDEVPLNDFGKVIEIIRDFIYDFTNVKIFISCRTLYFEKYENHLNDLNFTFSNIQRFSYKNIFEYLNENNIDTNKQELIKKSFFESYYASILYTPRYLELLVKYIKENKSKDINNITRCELFEYFIYKKIDKDKNIQKIVDVNILKRVIESLALVMEIYQVNRISKDELGSFFDEIKNDLKYNVLMLKTEDFIERSVLKDNIDFVEFENTEFQEYLAAKEISRFKDTKQYVFDLAVNSELKEIYPSWFNVLSFLIELNIDLLKDILDYGITIQKPVTEGYFDLITKINSNLVSIEIRDEIFKKVFEYHQINDIHFKYTLVENLSYYYTENNLLLLKKYYDKILFNKENRVLLRNIFNLIFYICERKLLSLKDLKYWTKKYENMLIDNSIDISIKKDLLFIIRYLNNKIIIDYIYSLPYQNDEELWEPVISNFAEIKINENILVHLIINGLKFRRSIYIYYLYNIKSTNAIIKFFDIISEDNFLIDRFLDNYSINEDSESMIKFFNTIKNSNDNLLIKSIKNFIIESCGKKINSNHHSLFLNNIIRLISSIDTEFIFEIIDVFSIKKDYWNFMLPIIFSECLHKDQVEKFIEITKSKYPQYPWIASNTLYVLKNSDRKNTKEIYEEGKKYFIKEFKEFEKSKNKIEDEVEKSRRKEYEEFKEWLNWSNEKDIIYNIFQLYVEKRLIISEYIINEDLEKLKNFTLLFLSSYNPLKSELVYLSVKENETQYRTDIRIGPYGYAIICAELLNLDVSKFRQNIVNYIPFAYSSHFQSINKIIKHINTNELEPIFEIYKEKKNDLWRFMPNNLFDIANNYPQIILKLEDIFVDYLEGKNTENEYNHYKIDALKILEKHHNNVKYLKRLMKKFKNDIAIIREGNTILISKYNDKNAIIERIRYIIENPFEYERPEGVHSPDANETEITHKYFAAPLMGLKN